MSRRQTGRSERNTVGGETIAAFIPAPLPPEPPLEIGDALAERLRAAEEALAGLELNSLRDLSKQVEEDRGGPKRAWAYRPFLEMLRIGTDI